MTRALIVWGNWGPYHYARFEAFRRLGAERGVNVEGLELFPSSNIYAWKTHGEVAGVHRLDFGRNEMSFRPWLLCRRLAPLIFRLRPKVCFVPSYWHWSLFLNATARAAGARIVMMNESHGGTEQARGVKKSIKRRIVSSFHAGLVGGSPHKRYFASLGLPAEKIALGYDAVDNAYFARAAESARAQETQNRVRLALPSRYILSLGRFVEKKNLPLLVRAFARLRRAADGEQQHLVFVGSGETEPQLRALCHELNLRTVDHAVDNDTAPRDDARDPAVHFYGFRQIEENPVFYALATAFVLPSVREEWGLVVNEAMACGLPVLVSRTAGCAEDLVENGVNGFQFDPGDADALTAGLQTLADDPSLARRMGAASASRIRDWGCERFADGAMSAMKAAMSA